MDVGLRPVDDDSIVRKNPSRSRRFRRIALVLALMTTVGGVFVAQYEPLSTGSGGGGANANAVSPADLLSIDTYDDTPRRVLVIRGGVRVPIVFTFTLANKGPAGITVTGFEAETHGGFARGAEVRMIPDLDAVSECCDLKDSVPFHPFALGRHSWRLALFLVFRPSTCSIKQQTDKPMDALSGSALTFDTVLVHYRVLGLFPRSSWVPLQDRAVVWNGCIQRESPLGQ